MAHSNTDCLSRLPLHLIHAGERVSDASVFNITQWNNLPVTSVQLAAATLLIHYFIRSITIPRGVGLVKFPQISTFLDNEGGVDSGEGMCTLRCQSCDS